MKNEIKNILKQGHTIISIKELAHRLDIDLGHETGPGLRGHIRELINEGCPIGAGTSGYFWIKDKNTLNEYTGSLQSRCDAITKRINAVVKAYNGERNARHLNPDLSIRVRCRAYVTYLAEESGVPYQAVWALAYRKFTKQTGVDTCNLPAHYRGSVINYIINRGMGQKLYACLSQLERAFI